MVTLCHAIDDAEVLFISAKLQSEDIPFFVVGENFGSLYPGIQISSYNERRFNVPLEYIDRARELLEEHRQVYELSCANISTKSKIRIFFETFLFGWSVPGGKKKNH